MEKEYICPYCSQFCNPIVFHNAKLNKMFDDAGVPLTPMELKYLSILSRSEIYLSLEEITGFLYQDDPNGGPLNPRNCVAILRKKCKEKIEAGNLPFELEAPYGKGQILREKEIV